MSTRRIANRPVAWPAWTPYRDLASEWHGGQWSALYAHASSGAVVPGLCAEIVDCIRSADGDDEIDPDDGPRLRAFLRWADQYESTLPDQYPDEED